MKYNLLFLIILFYKVSAQEIPTITNYNKGMAFTTITTDSKNKIWAGTDKKGLFVLDKKLNEFTYLKFPNENKLSDYKINSIVADKSNNIWVAHSGIDDFFKNKGGLEKINITTLDVKHLLPDINTQGYPYVEFDGIGTRNVQQVVVDKNNMIWLAQGYHVMTSDITVLTPGTFSYRKANADNEIFKSVGTWKDYTDGKPDANLHYPAYTYKVPISKNPGQRNVSSITSNGKYIYAAVDGYEIRNQQGIDKLLGARILKYHYNNASPIGFYEVSDLGFNGKDKANGIHINSENTVWVTNATKNGGLSVLTYDKKSGQDRWYYLNTSLFFASDITFNKNAIWEDPKGKVFFGTNKGFLVYDGVNPVEYGYSYTFYSDQICEEGKKSIQVPEMLSSNITYGVAEKRDSIGISWLSTDNGIMRVEFPNVKVYHIEDRTLLEKENIEGHKNYNLFFEIKNKKKEESEEKLPGFAVDNTVSSVFRYETGDFEDFYKGFGVDYTVEIRKNGQILDNKDTDRYGEFYLKKPENYDNNFNKEYVDILYEHPSVIDEDAFVSGKTYAEFEFYLWDNRIPSKPNLIVKHPIKFCLPPVLLIHGVWTNMSTLKPLENYLVKEAGYEKYEVMKMWKTERVAEEPYEKYAYILPAQINELKKQVLSEGLISTGKVNVIGHSRGGIDARAYIQEVVPKIKYNDDIHSLITLNSPHSGTQAANAQFDTRIVIENYTIPNDKNKPSIDFINKIITSPYIPKGPIRVKDLFSLHIPKGEGINKWGAKYLMTAPGSGLSIYGWGITTPKLDIVDNINFIKKLNDKNGIKKLSERVPIHTVATTFSFCKMHPYFCTDKPDLSRSINMSSEVASLDLATKILAYMILDAPGAIRNEIPKTIDAVLSALFRNTYTQFFAAAKDENTPVKNDFGVSYRSMTGGLGSHYSQSMGSFNIAHSQILKGYGIDAAGVAYHPYVHSWISVLLKQDPHEKNSNFYSDNSDTWVNSFGPYNEQYFFYLSDKIPANKGKKTKNTLNNFKSKTQGKILIDEKSFTANIKSGSEVNFKVYQENIEQIILHYTYNEEEGIGVQTKSTNIDFENTFAFDIPKSFVGKFKVTAYGLNKNGLVSMHEVELEAQLPDNVELENIRFSESEVSIPEMENYHFQLIGLYSDGIERPINHIKEGIQLYIYNTEVLEYVSADHSIRGIIPGKGMLIAVKENLVSDLQISVLENLALKESIIINFYSEEINSNLSQLKWETYQEINSNYFTLERSDSPDGNFTLINKQEGKGLSFDLNKYEFTDNNKKDKSYYRLRLYNLENKVEYEQVIEVNRESSSVNEIISQEEINTFILFPNPMNTSTGYILTNTKDKNVLLNIYNLNGQLISTQNLEITREEGKHTPFTISSNIPNGVYLVQLKTKNFVKSLKLIIKR